MPVARGDDWCESFPYDMIFIFKNTYHELE